MNNYKTSKDYPHLKQLLDAGQEIVCYTTYVFGHEDKDDPNHFPVMACDVCRARKIEPTGRYVFSVRGLEYDAYCPGTSRYSSFEEMCQENNIEFLDPEEPIQSSLVVELKQYLVTTPPDQQKRDWEQIKASLPDENQISVIFYGLSGSTSQASTAVTPKVPDYDPVKAQAQMKFREVSYIVSQLLGPQALLNFDQFLGLARYFSTWSLNRVLTEIERMQAEELEYFMSECEKGNEPSPSGAVVKMKLEVLKHYIQNNLLSSKETPFQELAHLVTKKTDQVIKNDNLEKELSSLLKESGVTTDYVHQDFLRIVARHFADYGKQEFIKAMNDNHVEVI